MLKTPFGNNVLYVIGKNNVLYVIGKNNKDNGTYIYEKDWSKSDRNVNENKKRKKDGVGKFR